MNEEKSTWWTPSGWMIAPAPEAYMKALASSSSHGQNWIAMLKEGGFEEHHSGDSETDIEFEELGLHIYGCFKPNLLLVELWNSYEGVGNFFVSEEFVTPFLATWLPEYKARRATCLLASETKRIREALVAFIRHGYGRHVITTYGDTLDDKEFREDCERAKKKREASQAGPS
jgi:hypothetical protein